MGNCGMAADAGAVRIGSSSIRELAVVIRTFDDLYGLFAAIPPYTR